MLLTAVGAIPIPLVPVASKQGRHALAYGEVTGHAHALAGERVR